MKIPRQRKSNHRRKQDRLYIVFQEILWTIQLHNKLKIIKSIILAFGNAFNTLFKDS